MDKFEDKLLDHTDIPGGRLLAFIMIFVLSAFLLMVPYGIYRDFKIIQSIGLHPVAVRVPMSVIIAIVSSPAVTLLAWIAIKRAFLGGILTSSLNSILKFIAYTCPLFILSIVLSRWGYSAWLSNQGYERCYYLTGPSIYTQQVWVRGSEYCIEEGSMESDDLVKWAVEQAEVGNEVTQKIFLDKAIELSERPGYFD